MYVNKKSVALIRMFSIALILGCQDQYQYNNHSKEPQMNRNTTFSDRHSGYSENIEHWNVFLNCWYKAYQIRHQQLLQESSDYPYLPILGKYAIEPTTSSVDNLNESIEKLEHSLNVTLPKSYKDFLMAYQPLLLEPRPTSLGVSMIGLYSPMQVGRFSILEPELLKIAETYPIESTDEEYFVYGTEQDDSSGRTPYLKDAIVVGKYGDSAYELIVLYPQVRTLDGEMEAALHYHSGEFRAPSFAELMRQLSFLETQDIDHVPPYSQELLKGTCADKLPMANVWWK